ncbi:hypothetical protein AAC387_Pa07g0184 [Persea americana]
MRAPHGVCNALNQPSLGRSALWSAILLAFFLFFCFLLKILIHKLLYFFPSLKISELLNFAIGCGPHLGHPCFEIHAHGVGPLRSSLHDFLPLLFLFNIPPIFPS